MEKASVEAVPRHQSSFGQRAAAGTVGSQQMAQASDVERAQLHRTTGEERQLEGGKMVPQLSDSLSRTRLDCSRSKLASQHSKKVIFSCV